MKVKLILFSSLSLLAYDDESFNSLEIVIAPSHQRPSSNASRVVEKPVAPPRVAPKIILKSVGHALTKKDCELIKDCVEALADQDCVGMNRSEAQPLECNVKFQFLIHRNFQVEDESGSPL